MATQDVANFRARNPAFSNAGFYPDGQVQKYLDLAGLRLRESVWADLLPYATDLFVSHYLALDRQRVRAGQSGGVPGTSGGVTASKSVDKVSVAYDTTAGTNEGAGFWNLTTYGIEFWQMCLMAPGAIQY